MKLSLATLQNNVTKLRLARLFNIADVVVWDLDGTLYQSDQLQQKMRQAWEKYYEQRKPSDGESFEAYEAEGLDWYQILQKVVDKTTKELCLEIECNINKADYVKPNKLVEDYFNGSQKKHYLFSNAMKVQMVAVLKQLGIEDPSRAFAEILGLEDLPNAKPAPEAYEFLSKILRENQCKRVLYIGDSVHNDLLPAKELGFRTIYISRYGESHTAADLMFENEAQLFSTLLRLRSAGITL